MKTKFKQHKIEASPLFRLPSRRRLARLLGISYEELQSLAKGASSLYREKDEPKKNGGVRHIEDPRFNLKRVLSKLTTVLSRIAPPSFLMCPVKGRSYVSNAAAHVGATTVRCLDIRQYFPSTPSRRVYWFFRKRMECTEDVAAVLTAITTFSGHLPTGSPCSPILSFFAHIDLWDDVSAMVEQAGCKLTVYIDDITISGDDVPDSLIWQVKKRIHMNGLRYHKERRYRNKPAEITGIIVRNGKLHLPFRQHSAAHQLRRKLAARPTPEEQVEIKNRLHGFAGQFTQLSKTKPA